MKNKIAKELIKISKLISDTINRDATGFKSIGDKKKFALEYLEKYAKERFDGHFDVYTPIGSKDTKDEISEMFIEDVIERFKDDLESDEDELEDCDTRQDIEYYVEEYYDKNTNEDVREWEEEYDKYNDEYAEWVELYYNEKEVKKEAEEIEKEFTEDGWKRTDYYESKSSNSIYLTFEKEVNKVTDDEMEEYEIEEEYEDDGKYEIKVRISDHDTPAGGAFMKETEWGVTKHDEPNYNVVINAVNYGEISGDETRELDEKWGIHDLILRQNDFMYIR